MIRKGTDDRLPGYIFLNNSPASEGDYRTTNVAGRHLALARKSDTPEQEERHLQQGSAALRTTYEVFVLHDLFADVVQRFDEQGAIVVESPIPAAMRRFLFPDPDAKLPAWLTLQSRLSKTALTS